jgi:hypothetical protein
MRSLTLLTSLLIIATVASAQFFLPSRRKAFQTVAAVGGFSPTDISGLDFWAKADAEVYEDAGGSDAAENGDQVYVWGDNSGLNRDAIRDGTGPTYTTGVFNGGTMPSMRFNGTTMALDINSVSTDYVGADLPISIFVVIDLDGPAANDFIVSFTRTTDSDVLFRASATATNWRFQKRDDGAAIKTADAGASDPSPHVVAFISTGIAVSVYVDGALSGSAGLDVDVGTITPDRGRIGRGGYSGSAYLDGDIGELIIYDSALSTGDRNSVESYLKSRWGTP